MYYRQLDKRQPKQTAKGKAYNAERKKTKCVSIKTQITKYIKRIESHTPFYDHVHHVQNDLQVVEQLEDELETAYQGWLSCIEDEVEVSHAHQWYEEHRRGIENFKAGIEDWIVIAKGKIEEQLEESPSELPRSIVSQRSTGSARAIERAKVAELMTRSAMLEKKQALRNEIERLDMQEKIAIAQAREHALNTGEQTEENQSEHLLHRQSFKYPASRKHTFYKSLI